MKNANFWKSEFETVEALRDKFRQRGKQLVKEDRPIFLYNCLLECTILRASGITPLKLAGIRRLFGVTEEFLDKVFPAEAEEFCELMRFSFPAGVCDPHPQNMRIADTTTCAALTKIAFMAGEMVPDLQPSYIVNRPRRILEREFDLDFFSGELECLREYAASVSGHYASDDEIWEQARHENHRKRLMKEIFYLQKGECIPIKGSEAVMVNQLHDYLDYREYLEGLEAVIEELRERKRTGPSVYAPDAPRLMVCDPCFFEPEYRIGVTEPPQFVRLIEECGGAVVGEDFCAGVGDCWYESPEEGPDPLRQLGDYYARKVVPCPFQTPNPFRITRLATTCDELEIDGIIHFDVRSCRLLAAEVRKLIDYFEPRGIPVLALQRIGNPRSERYERLRTEIETFIRSLQARKKGRQV